MIDKKSNLLVENKFYKLRTTKFINLFIFLIDLCFLKYFNWREGLYYEGTYNARNGSYKWRC